MPIIPRLCGLGVLKDVEGASADTGIATKGMKNGADEIEQWQLDFRPGEYTYGHCRQVLTCGYTRPVCGRTPSSTTPGSAPSALADTTRLALTRLAKRGKPQTLTRHQDQRYIRHGPCIRTYSTQSTSDRSGSAPHWFEYKTSRDRERSRGGER